MSVPENETLQLRLGEALKKIRERRALTKTEVARRMGKKPASASTISKWERGESSPNAIALWNFLIAVDASFRELDQILHPERSKSRRLVEIADDLDAMGRDLRAR